MHEWMADNGHTPHIVIDTSIDGVTVPTEHIKDGKIILNISIYAKETGQGMIFSHGSEQPEPPDGPEDQHKSRNSRSHLKVVK